MTNDKNVDKSYVKRHDANEKSREIADNYREEWTAEEVALLEEYWDVEPIEDIAAVLGRTIEGCRQKHHEIGRGRVRRARRAEAEAKKATKAANMWTRGFTSLDDMDAYFERTRDSNG